MLIGNCSHVHTVHWSGLPVQWLSCEYSSLAVYSEVSIRNLVSDVRAVLIRGVHLDNKRLRFILCHFSTVLARTEHGGRLVPLGNRHLDDGSSWPHPRGNVCGHDSQHVGTLEVVVQEPTQDKRAVLKDCKGVVRVARGDPQHKSRVGAIVAVTHRDPNNGSADSEALVDDDRVIGGVEDRRVIVDIVDHLDREGDIG